MKPRKVTPYVILLCISIFVLFITESFSGIMSSPDSIPSDSPEVIAAVLALVFSVTMFFVGLIGIIVVSVGNSRRAKTSKNVNNVTKNNKPKGKALNIVLLCFSAVMVLAGIIGLTVPGASDNPTESLPPTIIFGIIGFYNLIRVIFGRNSNANTDSANVDDAQLKSRDDEIARLSNVVSDLQLALRNEQKKYEKAQWASHDLDVLKEYIENSKAELKELETEVMIKTYDFSDYDGLTSEECKNKLSLLKLEEKELIKSEKAVILKSEPHKCEKKAYNNNTKQILRCFNAECDNILLSLSVKNIDSLRAKMQRSFETLNKIFEVDGVRIDVALLEIKLNELNLVHTAALKAEAEREEQKAIKAQMLEEEKVRREIEKEKQKLEKEEHQFKNEISKLMKYMQKASDIEKQLYIDKINELEGKLKLLEKDRENVLEREQNTRAGFVYVISNIGSFGENVYKIGMTRRLEPMDRVKELGDASVPFEFDVHAMIFSEDAPKLENILHETFRKYQVNKVNNRKEFFKVPLEEIETVVKENHNATVTFTMVAKAEQYRESLRLAGK